MNNKFGLSTLKFCFDPRSYLNHNAPQIYTIKKPVVLSLEDRLWNRVIELEKNNPDLQRLLNQHKK
jgi:hypothetical protein